MAKSRGVRATAGALGAACLAVLGTAGTIVGAPDTAKTVCRWGMGVTPWQAPAWCATEADKVAAEVEAKLDSIREAAVAAALAAAAAQGQRLDPASVETIEKAVDAIASSGDVRKEAALEKYAKGDATGALDDLEALARQQTAAREAQAAAEADTWKQAGALALPLDPKRAAAAYEAARALTPDDPDLLFDLGQAYFILGRTADALEAVRHVAETTQDSAHKARALGTEGMLAQLGGDFATAEAAARSALSLYEELQNVRGQAVESNRLGDAFYGQGDSAAAVDAYFRALGHGVRAGDAGVESDSLAALARSSLSVVLTTEQREEVRTRIAALEAQAKDPASALARDPRALGDVIANLAAIAADSNSYVREPEELLERRLALETKEDEGRAVTLNGLGNTALQRGDLAAAEESYRAALDINTRLGKLTGQAANLDNLGAVAARRGDPAAAEESRRRAADLYRQAGDPKHEAEVLANLGFTLKDRGDLAAACGLWEKARVAFTKLDKDRAETMEMRKDFFQCDEPPDTFPIYNAMNRAEYAAGVGDYRAAAAAAGEGYTLAVEAGVPSDDLADILERQSKYGFQGEDYALAESAARRGLEKEPTRLSLAAQLARALLFQDRIAEADAVYDAHRGESGKDMPWERIVAEDLGAQLAAGRDHPHIGAIFTRLAAQDDAAAYFESLGSSAAFDRNYDEAERHYARALTFARETHSPESEARVLAGLASVAEKRGRTDEACRLLAEVGRLNPPQPDKWSDAASTEFDLCGGQAGADAANVVRERGNASFEKRDYAAAADAWREVVSLEEAAIADRWGERWPLGTWGTHKSLSSALGKYAWYCVFARRFADAEAAARRGLEEQPDAVWIATNLAHALMFQDRIAEADAVYDAHRGATVGGQPWESVVADDFAALREAGLDHPHMDDVLARLGGKRGK